MLLSKHFFWVAVFLLRNQFIYRLKVPVMALTATATPLVRNDICKALKLKAPLLTCTGFDRPNLFLEVRHKTHSVQDDLRTLMVKVKEENGR